MSIERWVVVISADMLAIAVLLFAAGFATLVRKQILTPRKRDRLRWKPWGWALVVVSGSFFLDAFPGLASASAGWVFVCTLVALVPAAVYLVLGISARRPMATIPPT